MIKRSVKRKDGNGTKGRPGAVQPKYRLNLAGIEKLKASVEALDGVVTVAGADAAGENVSESLRTQRRAAVGALRAVCAAVGAKVNELRALRPASFSGRAGR